MSNTIWAAEYNSCIHESGFSTISLHKSLEKANDAVKQHKKYILDEWKEIGYNDCPDWEQWRVREIELKE